MIRLRGPECYRVSENWETNGNTIAGSEDRFRYQPIGSYFLLLLFFYYIGGSDSFEEIRQQLQLSVDWDDGT